MINNISKNPTVLIVEDDLLLLKTYGIKFKKEGCDTILLSDGEKAMEYLKETPPHAVLLGLALPGPSGFEILEAMRKSTAWQDIPVFILVNSAQKDECVRAEELGAIACIAKAENGIDDIVEKICSEIRVHE